VYHNISAQTQVDTPGQACVFPSWVQCSLTDFTAPNWETGYINTRVMIDQ